MEYKTSCIADCKPMSWLLRFCVLYECAMAILNMTTAMSTACGKLPILKIDTPLLPHVHYPVLQVVLSCCNWVVCVISIIQVVVIFQVTVSDFKVKNMTSRRKMGLYVMLFLGVCSVISISSILSDHNSIGSNCWLHSLLQPAKFAAIVQSIYFALYIPALVLFVPLKCNRDVANFSLRGSRFLLINIWLLHHLFFYFTNCCGNYYILHIIPLLYHCGCLIWMFIYCYPDLTYESYHWAKRRLPNCVRPYLRHVRDHECVNMFWRNIRMVVQWRKRDEAYNMELSFYVLSLKVSYSPIVKMMLDDVTAAVTRVIDAFKLIYDDKSRESEEVTEPIAEDEIFSPVECTDKDTNESYITCLQPIANVPNYISVAYSRKSITATTSEWSNKEKFVPFDCLDNDQFKTELTIKINDKNTN